jgi:hypothetical protein
MRRKTILVLAGLLILCMPLLARLDNPDAQLAPQYRQRLLTEVTDEAAGFWMIWWVDAGNISDFLISNTLQGGYFKRHSDDVHEYQGLPASASIGWYPGQYGDCAEYPKGSEQFYNFAWGLWVGSHYPIAGDPNNKVYNVSKGAFASDIGAMAAPEMKSAGGMHNISNRGMYFSDMTIPDGYGFDGVGGQLFAAPGTTPLEYQVFWPFTDSVDINPRRRAIGMPEVSPANGDIISLQDSYACGGDWIPVNDATCIWILPTGAYDVRGQGLRIEQRTYAWNYEYNNSYIFINYKIKNMNDFALDSVYFSFFMDNDIGEGGDGPGDAGYWDDLIGFDDDINLGYAFDSDGAEEGWVTPAGYIGAVLLDTPNDIGLTGFETWQNGHEIDKDGQDSLKYSFMASTDYVTWDNPSDVRMLMNCGPYPRLEHDEEVNLTIAVIVAYSYDELREKAQAAKIQFENGYFGYSPPPNPPLTVVPGDSMVYLTWGSDPEQYVDPMSGQKTFEGYRVYKSLSGLSETWQLLGDYDQKDSYNPDTAVVEHTSGPSKATIEYLGLYFDEYVPKEPAEYGFENNTYTITFQPDTIHYGGDTLYYLIFDNADQKIMVYDTNALDASGYCILPSVDSKTPKKLPAGKSYYPYNSGDIIFIDGGLYRISDDPSGDIPTPIANEVFTIKSYAEEALGSQAGVRHYYIDEDVRNGQTYYYSVTSYSKPQPTEGVESLEGGKTGKTYWAIPRTNPAGWQTSMVGPVFRKSGDGSALVKDSVVSPEHITGHEYEVGFRAVYDSILDLDIIRYAYFKDMDSNYMVLDSFGVLPGELSGPIIDGVLVPVAAISMDTLDLEERIDTLETGWIERPSNTNMHFQVEWPQSNEGMPVPLTKDFLVTIIKRSDGARDSAKVEEYDVETNKTGSGAFSIWLGKGGDPIRNDDKLQIYWPVFAPENLVFTLWFVDTVTEISADTFKTGTVIDSVVWDTSKLVIPPTAGDKFLIKTLTSTEEDDIFGYTTFTSEINQENIDSLLAAIRVVPNPYYVRAPWDRSQYDRSVYFQGLPDDCTIRIFNTAGLLIKTIEHNGEGLYGSAGSEQWFLETEEGMDCTSGLYIWQVETKVDGKRKTKVGKFAIVR